MIRNALQIAAAILGLLTMLGSGPAMWWLSDHCYLGKTAGCAAYEERRRQGNHEWP